MAADITLDSCNGVVVLAATTSGGSESMAEIISSTRCQYRGSIGRNIQEHGIIVTDSQRCLVVDNVIDQPGAQTNNTYDGIILTGNSDHNRISGNEIIARSIGSTRYGINVSEAACDCNIVVGNSGSPAGDFGTDAMNDAGSSTWLVHANDGTYGDNWWGCPPGS